MQVSCNGIAVSFLAVIFLVSTPSFSQAFIEGFFDFVRMATAAPLEFHYQPKPYMFRHRRNHIRAQVPTCFCSIDSKAVCANDGITYFNKCALDCERKTNSSIRFLHDGPCKKNLKAELDLPSSEVKSSEELFELSEKVCLAFCSLRYFPVCGSDGKTYGNQCVMSCSAKRRHPHIQIVHLGECKD